jgi:cobalt-zinc-cadmium efflux system outer membrane protein
MDGISLTRIARAALLPAVIGMSAANSARGDDPAASDDHPAALRPDASTPAPASFGGIHSPRILSARPAPAGPSSPRSSTNRPSQGRQKVAASSTPSLPPSGWSSRSDASPTAPRDRGWQAAPAGGTARQRVAGTGPVAPRSTGGTTAPRSTGGPAARRPAGDASLRRTQAGALDTTSAALPMAGAAQPIAPPVMPPAVTATDLGGQSISLPLALYGALTSNPDLVALRQGNPIAPSAEAVEVARRFPTTLNPTVWIDYRPITLIPPGTFGNGLVGHGGGASGTGSHGGFYHYGQNYILFSIRQPIELGHQTTHRYRIAKAAYEQQQWTVLQAELTALVQTYRFFQTAAYRREKYHLAQQLADFNDRLVESLQRQLEAGQGQVNPADLALARVESRGASQAVKAARQDYLTALADLRNQIGASEEAGAIEPFGEFTLPPYIPPVDEQEMIQTALANRPDIRAAQAQIAGTHAAVDLAKGDRLPTQILGPQYAMDEAGVQYVGLIWVSPLPLLNSGKPLVIQREAEHQRAAVAAHEAQQRAIAQVRAAVARWNGATDLVNDSTSLSKELAQEVAKLEQLFEMRATDLTRLMQARQRMITLDNSRLDAVWAATQAQSDLLLALGTPTLIHAMLNRAEADAGAAPSGAPAPTMPSPSPPSSPFSSYTAQPPTAVPDPGPAIPPQAAQATSAAASNRR